MKIILAIFIVLAVVQNGPTILFAAMYHGILFYDPVYFLLPPAAQIAGFWILYRLIRGADFSNAAKISTYVAMGGAILVLREMTKPETLIDLLKSNRF